MARTAAARSGTHRLPVLADGPGDRLDCALYEGCLSRWHQGHRGRRQGQGDLTAHCPPGCTSFASPRRSIDAQAARRDGSINA